MRIAENRCPWAIKFGVILHTRCAKTAGHPEDSHVGPGLEKFPYQTVEWFAGDCREYRTTRADQWSWEAP